MDNSILDVAGTYYHGIFFIFFCSKHLTVLMVPLYAATNNEHASCFEGLLHNKQGDL